MINKICLLIISSLLLLSSGKSIPDPDQVNNPESKAITTEEKSVAFKENLRCLGTEPHWSMGLAGNRVILKNLDGIERTYNLVKLQQSLNNTNQWHIHAESSNGDVVFIYLLEQTCSDDMSEFEYRYRILIYDSINDQTINGCCNKQES